MTLNASDYCAMTKARGGKAGSRLYPDLVNSVALKNLTREQAQLEKWPTYYLPEPCAFGHVASRFTANTQCVDCWRVKQGRAPLYPKAKNRSFYKQREPVLAANGASVIVAPAVPPEPTKREIEFLGALDSTRDFDRAAEQVRWARGLVEARASSNETFKKALADLCERRGIAWTRAPDPEAFEWSPGIERQLVKRFKDLGLLQVAREELKISASDFYDHIAASPAFSAKVEEARPLARETLRDRATEAAAKGNERLLKMLEEENSADDVRQLSREQLDARLEQLIKRLDAQGLIPHIYRHKVTGQIIDDRDLEVAVKESDSFPDPAEDSNSDLVSA